MASRRLELGNIGFCKYKVETSCYSCICIRLYIDNFVKVKPNFISVLKKLKRPSRVKEICIVISSKIDENTAKDIRLSDTGRES